MKEVIEEIAKEFELTIYASCNGSRLGKSYTYIDPLGINITFYEEDCSFEMLWIVPKSIFTIKCPNCSPYTNKAHFRKTYLKFWKMIRDWHTYMPEKYVREEL